MSKKKKMSRLTLAEQVYQELKERIINQELKPGSQLIISRIAEELDTSLTPVREALTRLAEDGLVEMVPHKGAHVAEPTKKNFEDLFAVRQALESLAVKLSAPKLSSADFEVMDDILEYAEKSLAAGDSKSWLKADEKLHDFIIRKSENRVLIQVFSQIWDRIHVFRVWTIRYPDRIKRATSEHRNIVSALRERDVQTAEKSMMEHIKNTFQAAIESEPDNKPWEQKVF